MSGFSRVILIGNLTRDPELRYTPQGTAVTDITVAVTTVRGGRGAEKREETAFVDVTVWDRQAEIVNEWFGKGKPILVEGRLAQDSWEDKETGAKRTKLKVVADRVSFLPRNDGQGQGQGGGQAGGGYAPRGGEEGGAPAPRRAAPPAQQAAPGGSPRGPAAPRPSAPPRQQPPATNAFDDDFSGGAPADDIPF